MNTKLLLLNIFLLLGSITFAQPNYGISIGTGFNKELIFSNHHQVEENYYKVSFKGVFWGQYEFFKKINFNIEANFFQKNSKINNFLLSNNFFENPIYLGYSIKKFNFYSGISNNILLGNLNSIQKRYTISIVCGLSFKLSEKFLLNFQYNRELKTHNIIGDDELTPLYYY